MIFDTTYTDKEVTKAINDRLGLPYSFWERIKLGGIGSHRIKIDETSDNLLEYINPGHSINYVNIELRKKGIIIHLKRRTQTYGWVVPYSELTISNDWEEISDSTYKIKLKEPLEHNASFFRKLDALIKASKNQI